MQLLLWITDAVDTVGTVVADTILQLSQIEGFTLVFVLTMAVILVALLVGALGAPLPSWDPQATYTNFCRECIGSGWMCGTCKNPGVWCECETPDPHDCPTCRKEVPCVTPRADGKPLVREGAPR